MVSLLHDFIQQSLNELRFCASSLKSCSPLAGICDVDNLWQWSRLKLRFNAFHQSTFPQKQFNIIIRALTSILINSYKNDRNFWGKSYIFNLLLYSEEWDLFLFREVLFLKKKDVTEKLLLEIFRNFRSYSFLEHLRMASTRDLIYCLKIRTIQAKRFWRLFLF